MEFLCNQQYPTIPNNTQLYTTLLCYDILSPTIPPQYHNTPTVYPNQQTIPNYTPTVPDNIPLLLGGGRGPKTPGCISWDIPRDGLMMNGRTLPHVGMYIPDDQKISRGPWDVPMGKPEEHLILNFYIWLVGFLHDKFYWFYLYMIHLAGWVDVFVCLMAQLVLLLHDTFGRLGGWRFFLPTASPGSLTWPDTPSKQWYSNYCFASLVVNIVIVSVIVIVF